MECFHSHYSEFDYLVAAFCAGISFLSGIAIMGMTMAWWWARRKSNIHRHNEGVLLATLVQQGQSIVAQRTALITRVTELKKAVDACEMGEASEMAEDIIGRLKGAGE